MNNSACSNGSTLVTRALIIDDHPIVHQACRRLFEEYEACEVAVAERLVDGFRLYRRTKPEIVIVDLSIDGRSLAGLSFIRRLRKLDQSVRMLVLSMHSDPAIVRDALRAGANGYVKKDAPPEQIASAFDNVRCGRSFLAPDLAVQIAVQPRQYPDKNVEELTRREIDILRLLGEGKSYAHIAAHLNIKYKTVANICSILKSKLSADTLPDLVFKAVQQFSSVAPRDSAAQKERTGSTR